MKAPSKINEKGFFISPVQRTYYLRLCIALAVSVCSTLLASLGHTNGLEVLYQTLGGGMYASGGAPSVLALLLSGVPLLVFCYLFSDFFKEGFSHADTSVFTRMPKRSVWLGCRMLQLCGFVVVYTLLGSVLSVVACNASVPADITVHNNESVVQFLALTDGLNALMLLVLLIPINITAIRIDIVFCFVLLLGVHLAVLLTCASLPLDIAREWILWLPTTQGVYAWHDAFLVDVLSTQGTIAGFTLLRSYAYLLVVICAEVGLSIAYIKRIELY